MKCYWYELLFVKSEPKKKKSQLSPITMAQPTFELGIVVLLGPFQNLKILKF